MVARNRMTHKKSGYPRQNSSISYPKRYVPKMLTRNDRNKQLRMLRQSSNAYKKKTYKIRDKLDSYKWKESKHVRKAKHMYNMNSFYPNNDLARKTRCNVNVLRKVMNKGMGAYYSSGSRPNQTPHSWGIARLASAVTGGKTALVDEKLLRVGCSKNSRVLKLIHNAKRTYRKGSRRASKYTFRKPPQRGGRARVNYNKQMKERIMRFYPGPRDKKYSVLIENKTTKKVRKLHFGHRDYAQYKDRTTKKLYSSRNHNDTKRQKRYYTRHSGIGEREKAIQYEIRKSKGKYTPKLLSHIYLW